MKLTLDWKKYEETAIQAIAEGCVLLENKNNVLPLKKNETVSVFGRIQNCYYKSGTGSGGKVNVSKIYNIVEGLELSEKVKINKDLQKIYAEWETTHPYDEGLGWGKERWSQDEMPLTDEIVQNAAKVSETAIIIIGRTAGEDKDNSATEGSYLLTAEEKDMLKKVRDGFKKLIVLLNVGNIIDMSFVDDYSPDAVMYVWQGGMLGGLGTAKVLTGELSPCGKLTDTIAYNINQYPSTKYFGDRAGNKYVEDIFVGYRYFQTFAPEAVRYPFGYGLSYSDFEISYTSGRNDENTKSIKANIEIKNTGNVKAKEVIQLYIQAPNGLLGKASKILVDFDKTPELNAGESKALGFEIPYYAFASYDDGGVTGNKSCWVLEAGDYTLYAGTSVQECTQVMTFTIPNLLIIKKCEEALAPRKNYERFHNNDGKLEMEKTPVSTVSMIQRRKERLPQELPQSGKECYQLKDVIDGKVTMNEFVSQFTDDDLSCIVRGEGMGSSLVTPGTASAYGGVSPRLNKVFGIPACCCDDGPSGMRLDCGIKAFSLPNGTSLACTFNTQLVQDLYSYTGLEMCNSKVDNLLGPGMNIHRSPLNGRNFEYFSEDPVVTGKIGTAMVQGLQKSGVTGTIKHFCGNEQEAARYEQDSVISERALREIYLKPFEIAVSNGADSVMTTYGLVNGLYTASSYDLCTTILRNDWGFKGIVMTDWWANINEENVAPDKNNFAAMIKAQNDLYMCCPNGAKNEGGDNTLEALQDGRVTRGELQRTAANICYQAARTFAMQRLLETAPEIEVINRPKDPDDINLDDIETTVISGDTTFDLSEQECKKDSNYIFNFDVQKLGTYEVTITASSDLDNPLAQLPCTLYYQGIPAASFSFHGNAGADEKITRTFVLPNRFAVCRLICNCNGLKIKTLELKFLNDSVKLNW